MKRRIDIHPKVVKSKGKPGRPFARPFGHTGDQGFLFQFTGVPSRVRSEPLRQPHFGNRVQFSDFVGVL